VGLIPAGSGSRGVAERNTRQQAAYRSHDELGYGAKAVLALNVLRLGLHTVWLWLIAGLVLGGFVLWLAHVVNWPVRQVLVEGRANAMRVPLRYVDLPSLQQQVSGFLEAGLWSLDQAELTQTLQRLPWVAKAWIVRDWPDTLLIQVEEYRPQARWQALAEPSETTQQVALLDAQGRIFQVPAAQMLPALPVLSGPDGSQTDIFADYQQSRQILRQAGLEILSLTRDARQAWTIALSNGIKLALGRQATATRLQRFVAFYQQPRTNTRIKHVDLRYTQGMAVTHSND